MNIPKLFFIFLFVIVSSCNIYNANSVCLYFYVKDAGKIWTGDVFFKNEKTGIDVNYNKMPFCIHKNKFHYNIGDTVWMIKSGATICDSFYFGEHPYSYFYFIYNGMDTISIEIPRGKIIKDFRNNTNNIKNE